METRDSKPRNVVSKWPNPHLIAMYTPIAKKIEKLAFHLYSRMMLCPCDWNPVCLQCQLDLDTIYIAEADELLQVIDHAIKADLKRLEGAPKIKS